MFFSFFFSGDINFHKRAVFIKLSLEKPFSIHAFLRSTVGLKFRLAERGLTSQPKKKKQQLLKLTYYRVYI